MPAGQLWPHGQCLVQVRLTWPEARLRATCKVFSLTIFLSCKNKGRTHQAIQGKTGASMAAPPPCVSPCMSHTVLSHTPSRPFAPCPAGSLAPWGLGSLAPSSNLPSAAEWFPGLAPTCLLPGHHRVGDGSLSMCRFSSLGQSSEEGRLPGWTAPSWACSFPPADVLISTSLTASTFTSKTKDFRPCI